MVMMARSSSNASMTLLVFIIIGDGSIFTTPLTVSSGVYLMLSSKEQIRIKYSASNLESSFKKLSKFWSP